MGYLGRVVSLLCVLSLFLIACGNSASSSGSATSSTGSIQNAQPFVIDETSGIEVNLTPEEEVEHSEGSTELEAINGLSVRSSD